MVADRSSVDAGLQAERTSLAWSRTSIAVLVNGLLVGGRGLVGHPDEWSGVRCGIAVVAAGVAVVVFLLGRRRRRMLEVRRLGYPVSVSVIMATGVAVPVLSVALLVAAVL